MAVWAGEEEPCWEGATQVPVVHSVSFGYDDLDKWLEIGQGKTRGHIYSRNTNPTDHEAIENAVSSGCKMLYLEGPTNPTMKIVDIIRLSNAASKVGALVVVDNTFATYNSMPAVYDPQGI